MPLSLWNLRANAIALLNKTISDVFPKVQHLQSHPTDHGFFCDILLEGQALDSQTLSLFEERMRLLIQEGVEFKKIEMARDNAAGYFQHHKQFHQAYLAGLELQNILTLIDAGGRYHLFSGDEVVKTLEELKGFKLFSIESVPVDSPVFGSVAAFRIHGTVFPSREILKAFLKKRDGYAIFNQRRLSEEMRLCLYETALSNEPLCWLPKGLALRAFLLQWWEKEHAIRGYRQITRVGSSQQDDDSLLSILHNIQQHTPSSAPVRITEVRQVSRELQPYEASGLWRSGNYTEERAYNLVSEEQVFQEIISSLQFIGKTVMMLGSGCHWVVCESCRVKPLEKGGRNKAGEVYQRKESSRKLNGKLLVSALEECGFDFSVERSQDLKAEERAYIVLPDFYGKAWKGPFVSVRKGLAGFADQSAAVVGHCMFGSIERYIAFLLEHYKGDLPLSLVPEQLRLIAQSVNAADYACSIRDALRREGVRVDLDMTEHKLGAKVHAAETERIPYIAVVGEREHHKKVMALRADGGSQRAREVTMQAFLEEFERKVRINQLPFEHEEDSSER